MRLILFILLSVFILTVPAYAETNALQCPQSAEGRPPSSFDIYDQSIDGKDYLTAAEDGWNLDSDHVDGHKIILACHYSDGKTQELEIPGNLDTCSQTGDNVICR